MKIKKSKSKKPIIISVSVFVLILLVAAGAYLFYTYSHDQDTTGSNSKINLDPPTNEQKAAGDQIKDKSITGDSTTVPESVVNISITAANQSDTSFQIRTLIEAVVSTGKCTLTLTKGTAVITKEAGIQAQSSSSTCTGFDIPITELSTGTWQATVDYKSESLKGTVSRSIDVK